jgi:SpoVK/Ycf46/Vps4 family AAA+-type ATPase
LTTHLKGEILDANFDISKLAKITPNYSGSDLKNICVSAALARIKENILLEHTKDSDELDSSVIKHKIAEIDDWGNFLSNDADEGSRSFPLGPLNQNHFDLGLAECPPSLSEEMETLVELRKWDGLYGDGASKRKHKPNGIGFALVKP